MGAFVLRLSRRFFPFITKTFADAGFAGDGPATATCITVEIVRKPADQVGFAVQPPPMGNRKVLRLHQPEQTAVGGHARLGLSLP